MTATVTETCTAYPSCSRIPAHERSDCPTIREVRALYDSWPGPAPSIEAALDRRETLARVTEDPWMQAEVLTTRRILGHPLLPRLVREVAVAEQPGMPRHGWLRRNSLTYGSWVTRGSDGSHHPYTPPKRRAWLFAGRIAADLGLLPSSPEGDRAAAVYVVARDFVRARVLPGGRS